MIKLALALLLTAPLTLQSPTSSAIRLGPTGARLAADDLEQIGQLDLGGRTVWVLVGHPHGLNPGNSWYVDAYLQPDHVGTRIRRGRIAVLRAEMASRDGYDSPKTWEVTSNADYAQVPVSPARPDTITGGRDLNRPFRVIGTVDDDSLVAIVSFIRTGPSVTPPSQPGKEAPPTGKWRTVEKSCPIASVRQLSASAAEVRLLDVSPFEKSGQTVVLHKEGTAWTVVSIGLWIAD
jgi:hypothetical protein